MERRRTIRPDTSADLFVYVPDPNQYVPKCVVWVRNPNEYVPNLFVYVPKAGE
jgi:hypothetical protein